MDDIYKDMIYRYFYEAYSGFYINHVLYKDDYGNTCEWIVPAQAVCNHKQIDKILKALDEDEDQVIVLEAMHSCIGCSGDRVPALED